MLDLTFGEQVKIILSRRGMTIKELAETIEERTGKKMSRQNLTQRLGRDNFQEQDMRMIAEILDCPFQLSILGEDGVSIEKAQNNHAQTETWEEPAEAWEEQPEEVYVEAAAPEEPEETATGPAEVQERDITIGELVDIHEELDAMIEREQGELPPLEEPVAELLEEVAAEEEEKKRNHTGKRKKRKKSRSLKKKKRSMAGGSICCAASGSRKRNPKSRRLRRKMTQEAENESEDVQIRTPEPVAEAVTEEYVLEQEEPLLYEEEAEEDEAERSAREAALAELEEFTAEEEDLEKGDINPYTGREYKSNSVRMHPTRIGYVQVYDRGTHTWTDMTEWAFLGYQERKKGTAWQGLRAADLSGLKRA